MKELKEGVGQGKNCFFPLDIPLVTLQKVKKNYLDESEGGE